MDGARGCFPCKVPACPAAAGLLPPWPHSEPRFRTRVPLLRRRAGKVRTPASAKGSFFRGLFPAAGKGNFRGEGAGAASASARLVLLCVPRPRSSRAPRRRRGGGSGKGARAPRRGRGEEGPACAQVFRFRAYAGRVFSVQGGRLSLPCGGSSAICFFHEAAPGSAWT